jgi:hypothetical protein
MFQHTDNHPHNKKEHLSKMREQRQDAGRQEGRRVGNEESRYDRNRSEKKLGKGRKDEIGEEANGNEHDGRGEREVKDKCRNGRMCYYHKKGLCWFHHTDEHPHKENKPDETTADHFLVEAVAQAACTVIQQFQRNLRPRGL